MPDEKAGSKGTVFPRLWIIITDYPLLPQSLHCHRRFTFHDSKTAVELTDLIEIHILELPKSLKSPENSDSHEVNLLNWLRFLRAETKEELDMAAQASPMINKAVVKVTTTKGHGTYQCTVLHLIFRP